MTLSRGVLLGISALIVVNLLAPASVAQRLSLGVVAGGYANSDFKSYYSETPGFNPTIVESDSGGIIIGPSLDVRLLSRLSLGVEALYKPLHYRQGATFYKGVLIGYAPATVVTWQFPVLARYRFAAGRLSPFVEGGPSFRATGNLNSTNPSHFGVSAGAGVETQWRRLRIAPRARYTRWAEDPLGWSVQTRPDQLEFLVGVGYAPASDAHLLGRRISFGAIVGSTVSDDFATDTYTFESWTYRTSSLRSFLIGPLVEVSISPRFSVEANAVTRSIRSVTKLINGACPWDGGCPAQPFRSGGFWEFPVLVKYRLATGTWRPFLALGPSFRTPKEGQSTCGATAGAGAELRWKRIKFAPTLRYTHWGPDKLRFPGARGNSGNYRNQVQALIGVSF